MYLLPVMLIPFNFAVEFSSVGLVPMKYSECPLFYVSLYLEV
jgi:hypothetical protein